MVRSRHRVAVVDDDASVRKALQRLLRASDIDADTFASAEDFLASLPRAAPPDCLVLDLQMPGMSGLDLQRQVARAGLHLPIVVITGHDEPGMRARVSRRNSMDICRRLSIALAGMVTAGILALGLAAPPAGAQQSLAAYVAEGCKTELETYCSQVTPGQNRLLACIYAPATSCPASARRRSMTPLRRSNGPSTPWPILPTSAAPTSRASVPTSSPARGGSLSVSRTTRTA